jgi:hypothetical protein
MRSTSLASLPSTEALRYAVIRGLAGQAATIGGEELVAIWQQRIADFAKWLGAINGNDEEKERRRQMVIQCAVTLARYGSAPNPVRSFCETILAAWLVWPDLGVALDDLLPLLIGLPHEQLSSTWELVLALRSSSFQQPTAKEK